MDTCWLGLSVLGTLLCSGLIGFKTKKPNVCTLFQDSTWSCLSPLCWACCQYVPSEHLAVELVTIELPLKFPRVLVVLNKLKFLSSSVETCYVVVILGTLTLFSLTFFLNIVVGLCITLMSGVPWIILGLIWQHFFVLCGPCSQDEGTTLKLLSISGSLLFIS